ncbi:MAG: PH domain-containing protein [bacterium]|nr:PH domain-containing protein [bacterium]
MKQLHPRALWFFILTRFSLFLLYFILIFIMISPLLFEMLSVKPELAATEEDRAAAYTIMLYGGVAMTIVVISGATLSGLAVLWAHFFYRSYKYELTDNSFRKELGVIWKQYVSIPYDRIQNIDIRRGVFARLLGLSELFIQTAGISGATKSEGHLPGLSVQDAEQLRDELIGRASRQKNQDL